jgi:phosphoenolpyruvate carboxylase
MTEPPDPPFERRIQFADKDVPLREDVSFLGRIVGDVIRSQGGEQLFAYVEAARSTAIRRRESQDPGEAARAAEELALLVSGLPAEEAGELARSFSIYFRAVNLAEQIHRIRRRRHYIRQQHEGGSPQRETLADTVDRLAAAGLSRRETEELLRRLTVEPVFTAHPTEATRREQLEKDQRIGRALVERLETDPTPQEAEAIEARIREEITLGWLTADQPPERPTVLDEVEHVLFYLTDVIYRVVPPLYEELEAALDRTYGPEEGAEPGHDHFGHRPIVRFASWVGGDMDGNPAVGADTVEAALYRQRGALLALYHREALELADRLTQGPPRAGTSPELRQRLEDLAELLPDAVRAVPVRHRDMIYRVFFQLVAARLQATLAERPEGYDGPGELMADLVTVAGSLEGPDGGGEQAGLFRLRRLIRRLETFGFHLATLDLRQDALVLRRVVGALLDPEGPDAWLAREPAERSGLLRRAIRSGAEPLAPDERAARAELAEAVEREVDATLAVFEAAGEALRRYGRRALGPFVISMAADTDDVLSVLALARWAGLGPRVPLDVAPLFETVDDLDHSADILAKLAADDVYREHLMARGDRQMVMIGYSDSGKDGGLAASRWALHQAQGRMVSELARWGVDLTIFHGRGGTVSRGGGKLTSAVEAAPPGAVGGHLRWTEQGEVIDASYGLRGIALRTLERSLGATALATAGITQPEQPAHPQSAEWLAAMETIARESRRAWRSLVHENPAFPAFFRTATPVDVIERLPIGSRPASRRSGGGIDNLRAIPWVFSWMQNRSVLPGWYGLGTGLAAVDDPALVATMARDWPFFRNLVADVEMVLAKADLAIAERYAALADEAEETGRGEIFSAIRAEHQRTVDALTALRGTDTLLAQEETLRRSIRLRNPYVDPMSYLQVELLGRWRAEGSPAGPLLDALFATVRGIAQGLRNTG